ncbi:MAG TPA: hypothetical protein VKR06_38755 [Ktedonosporobacter sp.]|nr:hypothetical protein [Ktedonosporobacter sp.]
MGWDLLAVVCTLLGGIAASLAIYKFIEESVANWRSRPKRPALPVPPALPTSLSASYQDYVDFSWQTHTNFGRDLWGKLIVYTEASRLDQEVHVDEYARWIRHYYMTPDKHRLVKYYKNKKSGHGLYAAVFDLPPDNYLVWIGKSRKRPIFKKLPCVLILPGKVTELYLP